MGGFLWAFFGLYGAVFAFVLMAGLGFGGAGLV
jgi:hypothetical protein